MNAFAPPPIAGPQACEAIANAMIGHFATRLEVEARKAGGSLTAEAIRALAERFLADEAARFAPTMKRSFDACTAAREARQWESARRHPFDRILAKPFAHLFPPRRGDDGDHGILSRRMLPGFRLAVDKMIGPALYEQCQRKAQAILDRHRQGGPHDWPAIHADPEARAMTRDVLIVAAHSFSHFERRRDWFVALVNSNLSPAAPGTPDAHWQMTGHLFGEMMRALFADLKTALREDRPALCARYGEQTAETVEGFLRKLEE
jgi:hypothetical protein